MRKTSSRLAHEVLWKLAQGEMSAPQAVSQQMPEAGPPPGAQQPQGMPPQQQQQLLQAVAQSGVQLPPEIVQALMQVLEQTQQQPGGPPQG